MTENDRLAGKVAVVTGGARGIDAAVARKPMEQITIREIAAEAGVHYTTFFRHHATKDAVLDHVAADQIDRLVELAVPIQDACDTRAAFLALCQ